jgi:hypothetical protein
MLKLVVCSVQAIVVQKKLSKFFAKRWCINDCLMLSEGLSQLLAYVKEFLPILL